nr:MFS transporter [uncultured Actinotalea sp.]
MQWVSSGGSFALQKFVFQRQSPAIAARAAVAALFFVNAVLYANLVPRLPEVKDALGLSNAELGAAIAAMPVGALVSGLFAPLLIQRLGSARVASFGLVATAVVLVGVPYAGAWAAFAALLLLLGALDAVVDVAQNAHGFRVQRAYGRSIVHAFHGVWSIGAVAGGLLGSAAVAVGLPLSTHLALVAAVFGVLAVVGYRFLLPGPEDAERDAPGVPGDDDAAPATAAPGAPDRSAPSAASTAPRRTWTRRTVLVMAALGLLAAAGAFVEDAGSTWGALYLRGEVGAAAATAGLAFVALQVAMTVGRLLGDRLVDRFGQRRVTVVGGAAIAVGMGGALAVPSLATTLVGFGLAGLGVATLVPAVMHAADEREGLPPGVGLTIVSWLLRVGFLVSPTLVGVVADATSLRWALLGVVVAGLATFALGSVLAGRGPHRGAATSRVPPAPGSAGAAPVGG